MILIGLMIFVTIVGILAAAAILRYIIYMPSSQAAEVGHVGGLMVGAMQAYADAQSLSPFAVKSVWFSVPERCCRDLRKSEADPLDARYQVRRTAAGSGVLFMRSSTAMAKSRVALLSDQGAGAELQADHAHQA